MDMSAYLVLLALAISDLLCCISTLPEGFKPKQQNFFKRTTFWVIYELYGVYFQNMFSHISTTLMLLVALTRFIVVCFPLTSKEHITLRRMTILIVSLSILWAGLDLPYIWSYSVNHILCNANTSVQNYYSLDIGYLDSHIQFQRAFLWTTAILGFILPVFLMTYCTIRLVSALRKSQDMQRNHRQCFGWKKQPKRNITQTLVAIIIVFIILKSPSEALEIFSLFSTSHSNLFIMLLANSLHTLQFSINVLLYTVVNRQFRKTFKEIMCCSWKSLDAQRRERIVSLTSFTHLEATASFKSRFSSLRSTGNNHSSGASLKSMYV